MLQELFPKPQIPPFHPNAEKQPTATAATPPRTHPSLIPIVQALENQGLNVMLNAAVRTPEGEERLHTIVATRSIQDPRVVATVDLSDTAVQRLSYFNDGTAITVTSSKSDPSWAISVIEQFTKNGGRRQ